MKKRNPFAAARQLYSEYYRVLSRCVLTLFLYTILSCTGAIEKSSAPEHKVQPPVVTGNIRLTFTNTFGENAGISSPWGLSFGVDGTLYVCDRDNSSIIRLDHEGNKIAQFSGFNSRIERIYSPIDVCSTAGLSIYALDAADSRILRFDRNLKNAFVIYSKDSADKRLFGSFNGLAFDNISGDLYITDCDSGALIRIDMLGGAIRTAGKFGSGEKSLIKPSGLDVAEDGAIYIADSNAGAVAVLANFGGSIRHIGADFLQSPVDTSVLPDGDIAVADKHGVLVLSAAGVPEGRAGYGADRIMSPRSVAFREGKLYVSDSITASILVFTVEYSSSRS